MSRPKYPCTRADLVKLPNNYTTAQSWDATQIHSNTALDVAIAQIVRGVLNVGNLASLSTTDKSSIVAAVNEALAAIITDYDDLTNKPIVKTADNGFCIVAHGTNRANKATAQNAFAEGGETEAAGISSHAEGNKSIAYGRASHAEGQGLYFDNAYRLNQSYGGDLTLQVSALNEGHDYIKPVKGYCLVCKASLETLVIEEVEELGNNVFNLTLSEAFSTELYDGAHFNIFIGAYGACSHVEGNKTDAIGGFSHAEGNQSKAFGDGSHAEGNKSIAYGKTSHAEGQCTEALNFAEHASGKYNKSTSNVTLFSVGIGADEEHRANAFEITTDGKVYVKGVGGYDGTNATASEVKALGEEGWCPSFPFGVVSGYLQDNYSVSNGIIDKENNPNIAGAFVIGLYNKVVGVNSFAHGNRNTATGSYSHAEGYSTDAVGNRSHSEGDHTNANGVASHSEGDHTNATGDYSHAEGFSSDAVGNNSHAEGSNTIALGQSSHTEGYYTKTLGEYSHAEGWNTLTRNKGEHACGTYNFSTTDVTLFSIGCGDEGQSGASSTRQNAFEVDVNGNIYIKGIGNYTGMNIGQSGVESVQEVIARLVQALGGNNS